VPEDRLPARFGHWVGAAPEGVVVFASTTGQFPVIRAALRGLSHHRRKLQAVLAEAALVAQLHLFFVVELHHHEGQLVFPEGQGQATTHLAQYQAAPKSDAFCAACTMCRQGAVRPATSILPPSRDSLEQKLPLTEAFKFSRLLPSRLSSRAPPLS